MTCTTGWCWGAFVVKQFSRRVVLLAAGYWVFALVAPGAAQAAETVTYTYDALGRLRGTAHAGGDNDQMQQTIVYDPAGNRTQYQVAGSKNRGLTQGQLIIVPLNGFTAIQIAQ